MFAIVGKIQGEQVWIEATSKGELIRKFRKAWAEHDGAHKADGVNLCRDTKKNGLEVLANIRCGHDCHK